MKTLKIICILLLFLSFSLLIPSQNNRNVLATTYNIDKVSSGGSDYTLYLDLSTTAWVRGNTYYFYVGIIVNYFGLGIYDFHEIVLWVMLTDGAGYTLTADSDWGSIVTEGGYYEVEWMFTPTENTPSYLSFYIGSEFWEDVGWGDPYTDDGWTYIISVAVTNPPPPSINHPNDMTFEEGTSGKDISWVATHNSPDDYYIYQDDVLVETSTWTSGTPITYGVSDLLKGDYVFTIYVYDTIGQVSSDSVNVHVQDTTPPEINSPVDITFEETVTGRYIEWVVSDAYPESYELKRNGQIIDSGAWIEDTEFRYNLTNLEPGTYTYCLTVTDESGLSSSDCVEVTVVGTEKSGNTFLIVTITQIITLLSLTSITKRKRK